MRKAYILAQMQDAYHDLALRIHTMYFLGTPHRGSDSAAYLKSFLAVSIPTGAKAYVKELLPDSDTIKVWYIRLVGTWSFSNRSAQLTWSNRSSMKIFDTPAKTSICGRFLKAFQRLER